MMDVEVVIETPQGSRNKYKFDHKRGCIRLDRMLFTSTVYPLDYGEIPGTLAEDGDPLDVLVWLDEPPSPAAW
jgi:inorganic pyrophosphatase